MRDGNIKEMILPLTRRQADKWRPTASFVLFVCVRTEKRLLFFPSHPQAGSRPCQLNLGWLASTKGVLLTTHPDKHLVCDTLDKSWVGGKRTELDETGPGARETEVQFTWWITVKSARRITRQKTRASYTCSLHSKTARRHQWCSRSFVKL